LKASYRLKKSKKDREMIGRKKVRRNRSKIIKKNNNNEYAIKKSGP
jgi:hypothetical protein